MISLNVEFDEFLAYGTCEISSNLLAEWITPTADAPKYAQVRLPSYDPFNLDSRVVECVVNKCLSLDTLRLSSIQFDVSVTELATNCCYFKALEGTPAVLRGVVLLLNNELYVALHRLPKLRQRLEFLEKKYNIKNKLTVVQTGDIVASSWCSVACCSPHRRGIIDFESTQIVLVKDMDGALKPEANDVMEQTVNLCEALDLKVKLKGLKFPVPTDLICPMPRPTDDDSLFAFSDMQTLLTLGIPSGSFIEVSDGDNSRIVKLFVLASPNDFESGTLYVQPRIIASFPSSDEVTISKYNLKQGMIPLASSVGIARVGSWYQSQKVYQNIILKNLRDYFTLKNRILRGGDMIPVVFDSNLASLCPENMDDIAIESKNDTLVWFRVESVEFDSDYDGYNKEQFIIDPSRTKLITTTVSLQPLLRIDRCDYISYYNLEPAFKYDLIHFPYAKKFIDILRVSRVLSNTSNTLNTSILLHSTVSSVGKSTLVRHAAQLLGFHLLEIDCLFLTSHIGSLDSIPKTIGYLRGKFENILPSVNPAIVYLSHLNVILAKGDRNHDHEASRLARLMDIEISKLIRELTTNFNSVTFVGSAYDIDSISQIVRTEMKFEIPVPVPTEPQRETIFKWYLSSYQLHFDVEMNSRPLAVASDVSYEKLAQQSAGLTPLDLKYIVQTAKWNSLRDSDSDSVVNLPSDWTDDHPINISMKDLSLAIGKARDEFSVSIGAPRIPNVTWKDVGGVDAIKSEILDTIEVPLKHPQLFASGMKKRSGILFYGPPGTGKTLMAKAIATNFTLNFFSVKGPELLNMYIGESEANVRRVFQKARDAKPCVIFFDELDSIAPKRGNQGDSGGVMDRIVSQLLAELDGMSASGEGVFVIGATNRPDLLDEALLRPGRFDKLLYLGIPDTNEKQLSLLTALTRKFVLSQDVDLSFLAMQCPFNYTGADFYALCSDAMLNAMTRIASEVDDKVRTYNKTHRDGVSTRYWFDRIAGPGDTSIVVRMTDFLNAQEALVASVSADELLHYLKVKRDFENGG